MKLKFELDIKWLILAITLFSFRETISTYWPTVKDTGLSLWQTTSPYIGSFCQWCVSLICAYAL